MSRNRYWRRKDKQIRESTLMVQDLIVEAPGRVNGKLDQKIVKQII